ncbi:MAG: outer membrane protein assembly factor BamB [Burkholderiales bacterium]|jgi:outer membrane assembly lipoprotein YfgL|nr:outer membrane protein assembly factor BamB [Burkholderiales bacterium]
MSHSFRLPVPRALAKLGCTVLAAIALVACSSGPSKPKPAELGPNNVLLDVSSVWTARVGAVNFPLTVNVSGSTLTLASGDGTVAALDARTGRDLWRVNVGAPVAAGAGSDGFQAAVVTARNEVVAIEQGKVIWRQQLTAQSYTAPLVAGKRVFVLGADRSVTAFDGSTGRRLWNQQRTGEPLVLRQSGVLTAFEDTLVVGLSSRLVGMNPLTGSSRWEAPIAMPRGANDIERLVDLVGSVSRVDNVICTRSFQAGVGCVDALNGNVRWSRAANGVEGVHGDADFVFGTESDGKVVAWRRANGEPAWQSQRLLHRGLTAPIAMGRSIAVGDFQGLVHILSREDGSPLNRLSTDGSAIAAAPVLAGNTLVVVTRNGGVYGFQPN